MTTVAEKFHATYRNAPDGWMRRRLRFDAFVNPKKSSLNMREDELVSFVPMDAVGEYGGLRLDNERALDEVYNGYTYFKDGDICVAKITPCFENGKGALAEGLTNGVGFGTTELHIVRSGPNIERHFLFYLSIADDFRKLGVSEMYGAGGQKRIGESFIKNWMPPVPPLDTQRRIVQFLDEKTTRIDRLIEKKRNLLDRLAEKRQALITQAVTRGLDPDAPMKPSDIGWLGDIPAHWALIPFKWRCQVRSGQVDPREPQYARMMLIAPDHIERGTGRLREVKSAEEQGAISGKYLCPKGVVLYSKIRPALRKAALCDAEVLCSADMYAIESGPDLAREYLFYFLLTDAFTSYAELESLRVAMPKVNREALGAFPIPVPGLDEQNRIVKFCTDADKGHREATDKIRDSIVKLEEYRSAYITAAVTGQIGELQ